MPNTPFHPPAPRPMPPHPPPAPLIPPAAWFVAALGLMLAFHAFLPGPRWLPRPWTLAGIIVAALGVVVHKAATDAFRHHRTTAAALALPHVMVVDGPYRHSRNPMYLGGVLMLLGLDVLLGSTTPLLVVPLWMEVMQARFIRREEALLARGFGREYDAYRAKVRRWL